MSTVDPQFSPTLRSESPGFCRFLLVITSFSPLLGSAKRNGSNGSTVSRAALPYNNRTEVSLATSMGTVRTVANGRERISQQQQSPLEIIP